MMRYLMLMVALSMLLAACGRTPEGPVVVRVNERVITLEEFNREFSESLERNPEFRGTPEDRERLLQELITRELMIQEGMELGLDKRPAFRLTIRKYYEQSLIEKLIDLKLITMSAPVSDAEVAAQYKLMGLSCRVDIAEVAGPGEPGQESCERLGPEVWDRITAGTCGQCHASFGVYSDIVVSMGDIGPELADLIASLEPGDVGGPIELDGRYVIVRHRSRKEVPRPPIAQVRQQLAQKVKRQKQARQMDDWLAGLRGGARISIDRDVLKKGGRDE